MSGTRWLLLLTLAAIVSGIAVTYRIQKRELASHALPKPAALPTELSSTANNWHWEQTDGNPPFRKTVEITAKNFRQVKESSRVDLEQVELRLYHKDGEQFDLVRSAAASFTATDRQLYSDGDVEITLGVTVGQEPTPDLVWIKTSGVRFDSNTGKADTDRPAIFRFEHGDGKSLGATYDPTVHALELKKEVQIDWRTPGRQTLRIEASLLQYYEERSEIWMREWGKLTRGTATIEGVNSVVHLREGQVERVEAERGHGTDVQPKRKLEYQAEKIWVSFNDDGQVQHVVGEPAAKLVSESDTARSTVTANRVEMEFKPGEDESVLSHVSTTGQSEMRSEPKPGPGRTLAETHVLRSDRIEMTMREGGREIEKLVTQSPGTLEFLPNLPAQRHRILDGRRIDVAYGPENRVQRFYATEARTRTEPNAEEKKRNRPVALTASQELAASFEPKSNRMATLEQWGDFTYEEGDRRARAVKATLDNARNVMVLEKTARVWDPSGSTDADRIRLDERSGDFTAEGKVRTSRVSEKKKTAAPGAQSAVGEMLTGDEPLHATAERMDSTNRNRTIKYTGKVTLWQGANRIQGDVVTVDREKRTLIAEGNVVSQLWEQPKDDEAKKKKAGPPVMTIVRAPKLVYTDADRLAYYTGGVRMTRPGLDVKGRELKAWMAASGAESSLERAVADGKVMIVQASPGRTRTGTSEHAEYFTANQKIVLREGDPQLVDSVTGRTRGAELTYFANDDRLLVNGAPDRPANSVIRKR